MKARHFMVLLFFVVLTRLPFVITGYGADGDAWRVAETASTLWHEGRYSVSRFPGFPVHEILNAPLVGVGGSVLSNAVTLVAFLFALLLLRTIVSQWGIPNRGILLFSTAFFPLLWQNSAATLDYIWGLAGILGGVILILRKRWVWAGIVLGLAAGTRMSHLMYLLPMIVLVDPSERRGALPRFLFATILTAILCYIPAAFSSTLNAAWQDFAFGFGRGSVLDHFAAFGYRSVYVLGLPAFLMLAATLIIQRKAVSKSIQARQFRFCVFMLALSLLSFFVLPAERAYLTPMIPFMLIGLFMIMSRFQAILFTVLAVSAVFVTIDVTDHGRPPKFKVNVREGSVIKEYADRIKLDRIRTELPMVTVPDPSVIMTGLGPAFGFENPIVEKDEEFSAALDQDVYRSKGGGRILFVYGLSVLQLNELRERGYRVWFRAGARDYLESFIGYSLNREGIGELPSP